MEEGQRGVGRGGGERGGMSMGREVWLIERTAGKRG